MALPPGQRFNYWLGARLRRIREDAGLSLEDMASLMGGSHKTYANAEKGLSRARDEEAVVAGYAKAVGIEEMRDIYVEALHDWYDHGTAPEPKIKRRGDTNGATDGWGMG